MNRNKKSFLILFLPHSKKLCLVKVKQIVLLIICQVFMYQILIQITYDDGRNEGSAGTLLNQINFFVNSESASMDLPKIPAVTSALQHEKNDSKQRSLKKNLMFVKTHKCGTSTLVDVFYLLGVRRRLNFVMHPNKHKIKVDSNR